MDRGEKTLEINLDFITNREFKKDLEEYVMKLFQTDKKIIGILLFGSLARNEASYSEEKISDIDILVVFEDNELPDDPIERIKLEISLLGLSASGFDSVWLTRSEFLTQIKIKRDLLLSALYDGKILYDPTNFIADNKRKLFKELEERGVKKRDGYWIWPKKHLREEIEW
ncbi:MAG: nucleotidyltransferase domain-containing protein [Promethearchaeota archaeon]